MAEIKELMEEQWAKPDRRPASQNRLNKLYPLRPLDSESWDLPLKVDASLQHLAKHITVPLEEMASFKDSMERRADSDLKKVRGPVGWQLP